VNVGVSAQTVTSTHRVDWPSSDVFYVGVRTAGEPAEEASDSPPAKEERYKRRSITAYLEFTLVDPKSHRMIQKLTPCFHATMS